MNVEDAGTIAAQYGIRSIPTLLVFRDGEAVQQFVGVQSKDVLLTAIESALATEGAVAQ
jgi:thioredoxin 1